MINLIGNLNADLILAHVKERPNFGEEHMVDHMMFRPGGLANLIYPLVKLGVKPRVIATLGKDDFGEKIYQEMLPMVEDGITRTGTPTAISVGVVNQAGSRYFVTYSGNLYDFTKEVVQNARDFNKAKASFFYGYFLLPNFGFEGTLTCLKQAKANYHLTFFDSNSDIGGWSEKSRNEIINLLPYIDYFMPNDEELLHLTGLSTIEESISLLFEKGAKSIILKQGSKGATAFINGEAVYHKGFPTEAFDTTGAGDGFNAGFMFKLLTGGSIEDSLAFGNALASIVVSRKENRYPHLDEITALLKNPFK